MLAKSPAAKVPVTPSSTPTETEIAKWTADGNSLFLGFMGTGSYSGEFRLYVGIDPDPWYVYQTSPSDRTAYVADRAVQLPVGTIVSLRVTCDSTVQELFSGTLLGGMQ